MRIDKIGEIELRNSWKHVRMEYNPRAFRTQDAMRSGEMFP
jgi:hypothetical protein